MTTCNTMIRVVSQIAMTMSRRVAGGAPEAVEASERRNRKHVWRRTFLPPSFRGRPVGQPPFHRHYTKGGPSAARRRQTLFFERADRGPPLIALYIYLFNLIFTACSLSRIMIAQTRQIFIWHFISTFESTVTVIKQCQIAEI